MYNQKKLIAEFCETIRTGSLRHLVLYLDEEEVDENSLQLLISALQSASFSKGLAIHLREHNTEGLALNHEPLIDALSELFESGKFNKKLDLCLSGGLCETYSKRLAQAIQSEAFPDHFTLRINHVTFEVVHLDPILTALQQSKAQSFTLDFSDNSSFERYAPSIFAALESGTLPIGFGLVLNQLPIQTEHAIQIGAALKKCPINFKLVLADDHDIEGEGFRAINKALEQGEAPKGFSLTIQLYDEPVFLESFAQALKSPQFPADFQLLLTGTNSELTKTIANTLDEINDCPEGFTLGIDLAEIMDEEIKAFPHNLKLILNHAFSRSLFFDEHTEEHLTNLVTKLENRQLPDSSTLILKNRPHSGRFNAILERIQEHIQPENFIIVEPEYNLQELYDYSQILIMRLSQDLRPYQNLFDKFQAVEKKASEAENINIEKLVEDLRKLEGLHVFVVTQGLQDIPIEAEEANQQQPPMPARLPFRDEEQPPLEEDPKKDLAP